MAPKHNVYCMIIIYKYDIYIYIYAFSSFNESSFFSTEQPKLPWNWFFARQPCRRRHGVQMIQRQRMMTWCHRNHRKHPRHRWSHRWRPFAWASTCCSAHLVHTFLLKSSLPKPDTGIYSTIETDLIIYLNEKGIWHISDRHFTNIDRIFGIWVMYPSPAKHWVTEETETQLPRRDASKLLSHRSRAGKNQGWLGCFRK